jgi:hypothetical protein
MNDALKDAITGAPVTVTLAGIEYQLAYPMAAVILYKKETAAIDRERTRFRPKMTRELIRNVRESRRELLEEAKALRPPRGEDWDPEKFAKFEDLMEESTSLKIALDEDQASGDSLYDMYNWRKISPTGDPERLHIALWVGLHRFQGEGSPAPAGPAVRVYKETLTRTQVAELVNLGNGGDLTLAISKALTAYLIPAPDPGDAESPNAVAPAETLATSTK